MDQPIVISMSDILLLAGAIVTISAAVKVIFDAVERFRKPNKTQDSRLALLEKDDNDILARLHVVEQGTAITQRAILALLAHGIDGNDIEAMKASKEELTDYLINR